MVKRTIVGCSRIAIVVVAGIWGSACGGGPQPQAGQLIVTPSSLSFGNVAVGKSQSKNGTLQAGLKDVVVSTASWNGQGYSLSGITFPTTVRAGSSISFAVTFDPQTTGSADGQISFLSDASNSPALVTLSGSGTQTHSVSLSWGASTSTVTGYNIYRSQSGGQYTKLNPSLITGLTFNDTAVQSGVTYSYAATSVGSNSLESGYSNIAIASIP